VTAAERRAQLEAAAVKALAEWRTEIMCRRALWDQAMRNHREAMATCPEVRDHLVRIDAIMREALSAWDRSGSYYEARRYGEAVEAMGVGNALWDLATAEIASGLESVGVPQPSAERVAEA